MTCPSCAGTGRWLFEDSETLMDCPTCEGSGRQKESKMTAEESRALLECATHSSAPVAQVIITALIFLAIGLLAGLTVGMEAS